MPGLHFLSYSSVDGRAFARRLYEELPTSTPPLSAWLDKECLRPSEDWDDQIVEALCDCRSLLFVMTKDSVVSPECKREWSFALKYKKPVLLLRFDREAEAPYRLQDHHYLDFSRDFDAGVRALDGHLRWLESPEGALRSLEIRLADARRDLPRAEDEVQKGRIAEDIAELGRQVIAQRAVVRDPAEVDRRIEASIETRLQLERHQTAAPTARRSPFINHSPGLVPSYFQDRHLENTLLGDFLTDDTKCLFTIVGRGGVGKTALVCRLLKHLEQGQLPDGAGPLRVDGIVYLSAAGTRRITASNIFADLCKLLPDERAEDLDRMAKNPQTSTESKVEALLAAFPAGRTVVMLDNFEDVLDPKSRRILDDELAESLKTVLKVPHHAVKVIVTTRVVAGALSLIQPARQGRIYLDEGLGSPYAENILRAMDTDGRLGLRVAPDQLLDQARQRTRGFPRALEALVAILSADRDTSLEDILSDAEHLLPDNVVEVLVGEAFNRLDAAAKKTMQALAACARPVSAVAVDYLLQPYVHGVDSAPILSRLANMQFVRKEHNRYYLHPVDRAYAMSKVPAGEPSDRDDRVPPQFTRFALWHRGADYFRRARLPREHWKSKDDLDPQLAEFALRLAGEDYDTAAEVLLGIDFDYLYAWGEFRLMADLHGRLCDYIKDSALQQRSFGNLGTAYRVIGQIPKAVVCYERALASARARGDREGEAVWLGNLANCHQDSGQTLRAINCHERALAIKRELRDRWTQSINLGSLGNCFGDLGQAARAVDCHEQALNLAREARDRHSEALILSNLADVLIDQGRHGEAAIRAQEGLKIGQAIGSPMVCIYVWENLAVAHLCGGDLRAARAAAEASQQHDVPELKDKCLAVLGVIATRQGDSAAAQEAFARAVDAADENLRSSPQYFHSLDAKGIALAGLSLHDGPRHVPGCVAAFRAARAINSDAGIVGRVARLLDALSLADTTGLPADLRAAAVGDAQS
jgi:tetratricopeptide (TPR) repeat protein